MKLISIVGLPEPLNARFVQFSPQEKYLTFVQCLPNSLELWLVDLMTGNAKKLTEGLNAITGQPYYWSPDEKMLYVKIRNYTAAPGTKPELPKGPAVQEAGGVKAPARTYQDLLRNAQDEERFDYYASVSILQVQLDGTKKEFLPTAIYKSFRVSPDGKYLLIEELAKPYSYTLTWAFFPSNFRLYDASGKMFKLFYQRPLQDKIPVNFDAVEAGKRNVVWRDDQPATLVWCVAPDSGNPEIKSEFRDQLFQSPAPFDKEILICKTYNRIEDFTFGDESTAVVKDGWYKTRNTKTYLVNPSSNDGKSKILFDLSSEDLYADPGYFHTHRNNYGREVLWKNPKNGEFLLIGEGYSDAGNKPFIDAFDAANGKRKRLWQADGISTYETVVAILDPLKSTALTAIQGPRQYPSLYLREYSAKKAPTALTQNPNPYKSLEKVSKQKIFYKRKDGVQLSATLYLPPGYDAKRDGRLPVLMEAYPTEYKDDKAAGQVKESPHMFMNINWASPLFWALRGFAVLEDAQFPIIGKGDEEPNDTYIEQLVADAEAAIRYVDSLGIADPTKVAVMGHSYGAFMTANLLAHSNLFAAGIARSGAYNRTLTPFGFQAEERTYWQAPEVYRRMSPFHYADQIKKPLLLIHGDADNNPGTFTLQSERLFQAIKGNGGTSRLVLLPYESHGYAARENILHMLWEMDQWLMKWVKR
jgi:dipeptidyl aminopeptidase/acylaminoacyl peptidase